jgi:lipopolysaccharide transport system ATP-binding protein
MPAAIAVRGVSKQYRLGEQEQYRALRDAVVNAAKAIARRGERRDHVETFWALQDVSFDVPEGQVLGLLGRNGAGKSTLLKVISRITTPTAGEIELRGRVGSLLEVGTGFHPELTGRENIFLNGAILGMSRAEIRRKIDEIVAFAEMETFLSTPVKHYSVGMYMRLAFAVAAHLDTEILIVDEVLAVGDARFQQKCLGKIGEAARSGRTVLFVSHNLEITRQLCDRCVLLEQGRVIGEGEPAGVIDQYLSLSGIRSMPGEPIELDHVPHEGTGAARMASVTYAGPDGGAPVSGGSLELEIAVDAAEALTVPSLGLTVTSESGLLLVNVDSAVSGDAVALDAGRTTVLLSIPALHLAPGRYRVGLRLADPVTTRVGSGAIDLVDPAFHLELQDGGDPDRAVDALVPARLRLGVAR